MNRATRLWVSVSALVLIGCAASKVLFADSRSAVNIQVSESDVANVVILQPEDPIPAGAQKMETIEISKVETINSYSALMTSAKQMAAKSEANIVKINTIKAKNSANVYDYLSATLYKAEHPRKYEKEFAWDKNRKLTWDDFRGPVREDMGDQVAAATFCGIGFETNAIDSRSNQVQVLVYNTFMTNQSWARNEVKSNDILGHEQCHFDICELYTRKMRERMQHIDAPASQMKNVLNNIYDEVSKEYEARQERYEVETEHGLITDAQQRWVAQISRELNETTRWAQN